MDVREQSAATFQKESPNERKKRTILSLGNILSKCDPCTVLITSYWIIDIMQVSLEQPT